MKIRRVDFSPDEWIVGTAALSYDERAIYITACALIYSVGGPIEENHLRQLCPGDARRYRRALDSLIHMGKLYQNDGKLSQKRCEKELERARKRHGTLLENAAKGGRPSGKINALRKPDPRRAQVPINHQPSTEGKKEAPNGAKKESGGPLSIGEAAPDREGAIPTEEHRHGSRQRGSRLPVDWQPDGQDCEFALQCGVDAVAEADEFRDYWIAVPGAKGCKLDWRATWRNHCRKIAARHRVWPAPRAGAYRGGSVILAAASAIRDKPH